MKKLSQILEKWIRIFIAVMVYIIIPSTLVIVMIAALIFYIKNMLR